MNAMASVWSGLCLLSATGLLIAGEPVLPSDLSPPAPAYAQLIDMGSEGEPTLELKLVELSGKPQNDGSTVTSPQIKGWRSIRVKPSDGVAIETVSGKKVAQHDLPSRLARATPVLVAVGARPDPFYTLTSNASTLIVIVPETMLSFPVATGMSPMLKEEVRAAEGAGSMSETEQQLLRLINEERRKSELTSLEASPPLFDAARKHSANMADQQILSHQLDDKSLGDRIAAAGFAWSRCAENIAEGQQTPEEAVNSWMNSPPHRENLLGTDYRSIGLGVAPSANGQLYWTMIVAVPQ